MFASIFTSFFFLSLVCCKISTHCCFLRFEWFCPRTHEHAFFVLLQSAKVRKMVEIVRLLIVDGVSVHEMVEIQSVGSGCSKVPSHVIA